MEVCPFTIFFFFFTSLTFLYSKLRRKCVKVNDQLLFVQTYLYKVYSYRDTPYICCIYIYFYQINTQVISSCERSDEYTCYSGWVTDICFEKPKICLLFVVVLFYPKDKPYHIMPYHTISYHFIPHCTKPCHTIYHTIPGNLNWTFSIPFFFFFYFPWNSFNFMYIFKSS